MINKYVWVWISLFLAALTPQCWANPLVTNSHLQAQVYASDAQYSLYDVQRLPSHIWTTENAAHINHGFTKQHFWIRLDLEQLKFDFRTSPWVLQLGYPLLDYIDLYIVDDFGSVLVHRLAGNNFVFSQRPMPIPEFAFPIPALTNAKTAYIYLRSNSSMQVPISAYSESDFWQQRSYVNGLNAAFWSVLMCMLVYNLLSWWLSRDRLILLYSASMASFMIMMANLHGWSYAYILSDAPEKYDTFLLLSLSLSEVFLALFGMKFLQLQNFPRLHRLYLTYIISAIILGIAALFIEYRIAVQLLAALAVAMSLSALVLATFIWYRTRSRDVLLFFMAAFAMIAGLLIYALQKFGLIPITSITERAPELGYIILVVLLALSLAERQNRERQARIAAQDVLIRMQREANQLLDQKVRERTRDLERLNKHLLEQSTTDALTKVRNRRYFDERLYSMYQDAYRNQSPLSLLLLDVDHFKSFNDQWGHALGDQVLKQAAQVMQQHVKRPLDSVYRYGGEEFAILLPDTGLPGALQIAENIRASIEQLDIQHNDKKLHITISVGVCSLIPSERDNEQGLCSLADKALYQAKHAGRNRVCVGNQTNLVKLMSQG